VEVRIAEGKGLANAFANGAGTTEKRAEQEAARRAFDKLRKQAGEPLAEGNVS
jgi:dsRNA-specific ribonuclease